MRLNLVPLNPELDMHSAMLKIISKKFKPEYVESLINEFSEACGELSEQVTVQNFVVHSQPELLISNEYLVNGYDPLIYDLALDLNIRLNTSVTNIEITKDNKFNVHTQCGQCFTADRAVVTLPLGVLKAKLVQFSPELPLWKEKALSTIEVGSYNRFYLRFPEIFWEQDKHWFVYCGSVRGWFSQWFNLYPFIKEPILCAFISGHSVPKGELLSDAELSEQAMEVLRQMFGDNIPNPSDILGTRWVSDPFTYGGAHSFPNLQGDSEQFELLAKPIGPLHFAGEACRKKNQSGTVGSSLESGYRAADEILSNQNT